MRHLSAIAAWIFMSGAALAAAGDPPEAETAADALTRGDLSVFQKWFEQGRDWLIATGPSIIVKAILFVVIVIAFKILGTILGRITQKALSTRRVRVSDLLRNFFTNAVNKTVYLVGILLALAAVGVPIGPVLAGAGILGFVVGFALQNTLANFAAGVMIMLYRPYDIGDAVSAGGVTGKVEAMTLVSTNFLTPDNQVLVVPNGKIWGDVITNITANQTRRVDLTVGVGYECDVARVEEVLHEVVKSHPKVHSDPAPVVKCHNLGESSVDFVVRPWTNTSDYWDVYWDLTRSIKLRLDAEGISIPYPQRDIHIVSGEALQQPA